MFLYFLTLKCIWVINKSVQRKKRIYFINKHDKYTHIFCIKLTNIFVEWHYRRRHRCILFIEHINQTEKIADRMIKIFDNQWYKPVEKCDQAGKIFLVCLVHIFPADCIKIKIKPIKNAQIYFRISTVSINISCQNIKYSNYLNNDCVDE